MFQNKVFLYQKAVDFLIYIKKSTETNSFPFLYFYAIKHIAIFA